MFIYQGQQKLETCRNEGDQEARNYDGMYRAGIVALQGGVSLEHPPSHANVAVAGTILQARGVLDMNVGRLEARVGQQGSRHIKFEKLH